jgi:hypothetical protein
LPYLAAGFFPRDVLWLFALALPRTALGLYAGHHAHTNIGQGALKRPIGVLLVGSGLALLLKCGIGGFVALPSPPGLTNPTGQGSVWHQEADTRRCPGRRQVSPVP